MEPQDRNLLFSAMREGKPLKSYIKTILGKEFIHIWDSLSNQPSGLILTGDPRKKEEGCIIDIWTEQEDVFFTRMNRKDLDTGIMIEFKRTDEEPKKSVESSSDETLKELINSPFLKFQHVLNATESIPLLFRLKNLSIEMEKSQKIIRAIEARISEIQLKEYEVKEPEIVEL